MYREPSPLSETAAAAVFSIWPSNLPQLEEALIRLRAQQEGQECTASTMYSDWKDEQSFFSLQIICILRWARSVDSSYVMTTCLLALVRLRIKILTPPPRVKTKWYLRLPKEKVLLKKQRKQRTINLYYQEGLQPRPPAKNGERRPMAIERHLVFLGSGEPVTVQIIYRFRQDFPRYMSQLFLSLNIRYKNQEGSLEFSPARIYRPPKDWSEYDSDEHGYYPGNDQRDRSPSFYQDNMLHMLHVIRSDLRATLKERDLQEILTPEHLEFRSSMLSLATEQKSKAKFAKGDFNRKVVMTGKKLKKNLDVISVFCLLFGVQDGTSLTSSVANDGDLMYCILADAEMESRVVEEGYELWCGIR